MFMQGTVSCQVFSFHPPALHKEPLPNSKMDRRNGQTDLSWSLREKRSVIGGKRIEQMLPRVDGSPRYKFKWLSLAETGLGVPDHVTRVFISLS